MRLALIGPCDQDIASLARAAWSAIDRLAADRVVYLAADDGIDAVVEGWLDLIGARDSLLERARSRLDGGSAAISAELFREDQRDRLRRLHRLPASDARAIELLHDRLVLMVEDKGVLDEEDILPASIIAFGRGDPTIRRVGSRLFAGTGQPSKPREGLLLIDESAEGVAIGLTVSLCDADGNVVQHEFVESTRSTRMRVYAG